MKKLSRDEMKKVNGGKKLAFLCAEYSTCTTLGECSTKVDGCKCRDISSGLVIPSASAFCSAS